jgi:hypoxanthine phosphoribosyltransferase
MEIEAAVKNVAGKINSDMKNVNLPVFLSVLNGSFMFTADLMKHIDFDCNLCFVKLKSYSGFSSAGSVNEIIGMDFDLAGKTVIILEDIVDTGATLEYLVDAVSKHRPGQLKVATMLFKPGIYDRNIVIDYAGLSVSNDFIVGYGLDYNGLGRNYPDIYRLISNN